MLRLGPSRPGKPGHLGALVTAYKQPSLRNFHKPINYPKIGVV
jgi:hypothetical protein